jgi:hypothetical protein
MVNLPSLPDSAKRNANSLLGLLSAHWWRGRDSFCELRHASAPRRLTLLLAR